MKQKLLAIIGLCLMLTVVLTGCGKKAETEPTTPTSRIEYVETTTAAQAQNATEKAPAQKTENAATKK